MKRKQKDLILNGITYLFSSFGMIVLLAIIIFIFSKGYKLLSFDLLVSDYYETIYDTRSETNPNFKEYENPNQNNSYFSKNWGIALKDSFNKENEKVVVITYIDEYSPFRNMIDTNNNNYVEIKIDQQINKIIAKDINDLYLFGLSTNGAKSMVEVLDNTVKIENMITATSGGGIRGSIITTLYLILLTLILALPLGIGAAIYLHELSNENKATNFLRSMIDMLSGVPSIIFGLLGAIVFIPFTSKILNANGGNLLSGALTLTIILLPIIIKTTEEALMTIPNDYRQASLALGSSQTQTTFKVVIPNAIPGILTATLLSIGRIIGESAALIYAIGTSIKDQVFLSEKSTTLAVHIWSLMSGENPNLELACTISIIILIVVFLLSMLTKYISKKITRF